MGACIEIFMVLGLYNRSHTNNRCQWMAYDVTEIKIDVVIATFVKMLNESGLDISYLLL